MQNTPHPVTHNKIKDISSCGKAIFLLQMYCFTLNECISQMTFFFSCHIYYIIILATKHFFCYLLTLQLPHPQKFEMH